LTAPFSKWPERAPNNGTISTNLVTQIGVQLRGTRCRLFSKGMKVRSGPARSDTKKGVYSYPDLVVVRGEMKFHDQHRDVLVNPSVIIEVLSESTEAFDRGAKFLRYQDWNPTLTDYLLVSQASAVIDHFVRQGGGWIYTIYQGIDRSVPILSIDCTLHLREVYERIEFSPQPEDQPSEQKPLTQ
jgi:Uma2 family endonuclease